MNITNLVLDERQIKAGLCVEEEEDFVFLKTQGGNVIGAFTHGTRQDFIKVAADVYLSQIDYMEDKGK